MKRNATSPANEGVGAQPIFFPNFQPQELEAKGPSLPTSHRPDFTPHRQLPGAGPGDLGGDARLKVGVPVPSDCASGVRFSFQSAPCSSRIPSLSRFGHLHRFCRLNLLTGALTMLRDMMLVRVVGLRN